MNRKLKNLKGFIIVLCLSFALAMPVLAVDEITIIDNEDIEQYTYSVYPEADMLVMMETESIPVYLEDNISSNKIDKLEIQGLLQEAENKPECTDYNLFVIKDDFIYFYADVNSEVSISVFETQMADEYGVDPLINIGESSSEFPSGIGCKAYTDNSVKTKFEATFYTENINYAGSVSNLVDNDRNKMINLYNYIGNVSTNGIATDLGVQYSATYQGWQPYFCYNGNTSIGKVVSDKSFYYKGTASYPTTIAIDRNAQYNGSNGFKLTVSGRTTSNTSGTTVMFGGQPLGSSFSPKYKIVSTIGSVDRSNIKSGAGFKTYWTNIKIDGTTVNNYPDAYYFNGSISKLNSTGATFTLSRE